MTDEDSGADDTPSRNARPNWGLDRRRYLQALGAVGLLGSGTTAAAAAPDDGLTVEVPDDDWEESADERIAEHRTVGMTVDVVDADGNAVEGADVDVEMHEHAFGFGTAVNAGTLIDDTESGDNYRRYITELFNKAVFENRYDPVR